MVKMEEKINLLVLCSAIRRECVPSPCQNPLPALPFQVRARWVTKVCMIALIGVLRREMTVVSPYAFPERQLSHADLNRSNDLHWLSIG